MGMTGRALGLDNKPLGGAPPPDAREAQVISLEPDHPGDEKFIFDVRAPGKFLQAFAYVKTSAIAGVPPKVVAAVAFDTLSHGATTTRTIFLVKHGRALAPEPGHRIESLGMFLDPSTREPVTVYEQHRETAAPSEGQS